MPDKSPLRQEVVQAYIVIVDALEREGFISLTAAVKRQVKRLSAILDKIPLQYMSADDRAHVEMVYRLGSVSIGRPVVQGKLNKGGVTPAQLELWPVPDREIAARLKMQRLYDPKQKGHVVLANEKVATSDVIERGCLYKQRQIDGEQKQIDALHELSKARARRERRTASKRATP